MNSIVVKEFMAEIESCKDLFTESYYLDMPENTSALNRAYLDVLVALTNLSLALKNYEQSSKRNQYFPQDDNIKTEAISVTEGI